MNTSGDLNLGESRLDAGLNNNEIENVVLHQSQHNNS